MDEEKNEKIELEKIEMTQEMKNINPQITVNEEPKKQRKGLCIAAMVLGIVALLLFCLWYVSIPCAILAIIFGILGIKSEGKGMAIAGLVTGTIGLVIWIILIILVFTFGFAMGISDTLDNYEDLSYEDYEWYNYD